MFVMSVLFRPTAGGGGPPRHLRERHDANVTSDQYHYDQNHSAQLLSGYSKANINQA